jgi:hypothetical protein
VAPVSVVGHHLIFGTSASSVRPSVIRCRVVSCVVCVVCANYDSDSVLHPQKRGGVPGPPRRVRRRLREAVERGRPCCVSPTESGGARREQGVQIVVLRP